MELVAPLRPVELQTVEANGHSYVVLRDRLDPLAPPLVVTREALLLLSLIDGTRDVGRLKAGFALRTGVQLPERWVEAFVQQLDQAGLLDSEGYRRKLEGLQDEFRRSPERGAVHAGGAYPAEAEALRAYLDSFYTHADGPGAAPSPAGRQLLGLVAPHVDLHRGGPTYAWAYKALAEAAPADLYVVLGTCHTPMTAPFAATRKPYATPLGTVETDQVFLDALADRCTWDLFADEFSHRAEHSVEFQAVYLRYLMERPRMVALLCDSLHVLVPPGESPSGQPAVAGFVQALQALAAAYPGRVCFIAGADLAHVGPQFGDPFRVTHPVLAQVGQRDLELLEFVRGADAEGFYQQVMADQDARKICGLTPLYVVASLMAGAAGELLKYSQWADPSGRGSVTFASLAFWTQDYAAAPRPAGKGTAALR